jgi:hypothetical protein
MTQAQAKPKGSLRRRLDGRQESREISERLKSERRARAKRGSEVPRRNVTPPGPPTGVGGF